MEPTPAELATIHSSEDPFGAVLAWVGLGEAVLQGLRSHLGDFQKLREVAYIDAEDWNGAKTAVEITKEDGNKRKLLALEKVLVGMQRDVAVNVLNSRSGASSANAGGGSNGGEVGNPVGSSSASGLQPPRKASFKNTIDQSDETEFVPMGSTDFRKYQRQFEEGNDSLEAADAEVCTADQFQAVKLKLDNG